MAIPEQTKQQLQQLKSLFESEEGNTLYDRITDFIPGIVYVYDTNNKKLRNDYVLCMRNFTKKNQYQISHDYEKELRPKFISLIISIRFIHFIASSKF